MWCQRAEATNLTKYSLFVRVPAIKVHKEMFKDDPELRKEFQVVKCERDEDL